MTRTTSFHVVSFPARELRAFARRIAPNRVEYTTPADWFARVPTLQLVMDGPIYGEGGRLQRAILDRASGLDETGILAGEGATVSIVNGKTQWLSGATRAPGATVAIQGSPRLVWAGVNVQNPNDDIGHEWRAGIGSRADDADEIVFCVGKGPMHHFADDARDAGLRWFVYTDGGNSTQLVWRNGQRYGYPTPRPVATFLGRALAPEPQRPRGLTDPLVAGALALLAGTASVFGYRAWQLSAQANRR